VSQVWILDVLLLVPFQARYSKSELVQFVVGRSQLGLDLGPTLFMGFDLRIELLNPFRELKPALFVLAFVTAVSPIKNAYDCEQQEFDHVSTMSGTTCPRLYHDFVD
jgi:hypothetical protein